MSNLKAAIAEAMKPGDDEKDDPFAPDEDTAEEAEVTEGEDGDETPGEAPGSAEADVDTEVDGDESEGEATDDVPTEYFGVDLSSLPAEVRRDIIAGYQERDKFIQSLLQKKEETPETAAPPAVDEPPAAVTDEDLLAALGIDVENDPYAESAAKAALPLARLVLEQQAKLDSLVQRADVNETEQYWRKSLDNLEESYGPLPREVTREALIAYAAQNGIAEPQDAYWRVVGPARKSLLDEVEAKRSAIEVKLKKQGAAASPRPKSTTKTVEKGPESRTVKGAVAEVFNKLAAERGLDLRPS